MQMLPEIHRNSRTGCNCDSLGLFARFFQDGNGLPEHWNTNPLVEAEKKTLIKWKVWNIPLFWAQMFCTKIQVPFRMKTPCGLFCFSFFRFRSNFAKGYINQYVCSLGINQRQLGDESAGFYHVSRRKYQKRPVSNIALHWSGPPNDCFLWNICSEKQMMPKIFCFRTA